MIIGSAFSGSGAMDLAFERAGGTIAWQIEIDSAAQGVLARHWPEIPRWADVTQVTATDLAPIEVLIGGTPCQDVSVSGLRRGLAGERSGLFFEYVRLLESLRPRWFLFENVPGLLSSNARRDFAYVLSALAQCGYGLAWRVLDSRYFGVPQRRRRVFIVGYRGDPTGPAQVLFESDRVSRHSPPGDGKGRDTPPDAGPGAPIPGQSQSGRTERVVGTLMASGAGLSRPAGQSHEVDFLVGPDDVVEAWSLQLGQTSAHTMAWPHIAPTAPTDGSIAVYLPSGSSETTQGSCGTSPDASMWVIARSEHFAVDAGVVPTLRASSTQTIAFVPETLVRRLTPREAERLQGLPDDWTRWTADGRELSDTTRYRLVGNAVTVPVVQWIAARMHAIDARVALFPDLALADEGVREAHG